MDRIVESLYARYGILLEDSSTKYYVVRTLKHMLNNWYKASFDSNSCIFKDFPMQDNRLPYFNSLPLAKESAKQESIKHKNTVYVIAELDKKPVNVNDDGTRNINMYSGKLSNSFWSRGDEYTKDEIDFYSGNIDRKYRKKSTIPIDSETKARREEASRKRSETYRKNREQQARLAFEAVLRRAGLDWQVTDMNGSFKSFWKEIDRQKTTPKTSKKLNNITIKAYGDSYEYPFRDNFTAEQWKTLTMAAKILDIQLPEYSYAD